MAVEIFINYRGSDADYVPALLFERLSRHFGARRVFLDAESIAPGEDYVQRLLEGVRSSKVLLAVIGPQWFATDAAGRRLIDNEHDWIRRELVTAFACEVTVIPVFTEGATPPRPEDLPADIAQLGRQHGLPLRKMRSGEDVEAIVREVSRHVTVRRRFLLGVAAAVVLVAAGATLPSLLHESDTPGAAPGPSSTSQVVETTTSTSPTTSTTTTKPPEPQVLWKGSVNLDYEVNQVSFALDWSPPQRTLGGDIGLCNEFLCSRPGSAIAGKAFAQWTGEGLPEHGDCEELLKKTVGEPTLPVKVGTRACLATEGKRIGRLEVVEIGGPGKMKIDVKVWDLPPR